MSRKPQTKITPTMQTRKYYLAYGMNSNKGGMAARCPQAQDLGKVTLPGYKLVFSNHCDVAKAPGKSMECVLWSITPECERSLDALEGYPDYYGKTYVPVNYNGKRIQAMIYFMTDSYRGGYPNESYVRMVAQGYVEHGISIDQIEDALDELDF